MYFILSMAESDVEINVKRFSVITSELCILSVGSKGKDTIYVRPFFVFLLGRICFGYMDFSAFYTQAKE